MAQIRTTSGGNFSKYNAFVEKMILDSMNNNTKVIHGSKKISYTIKNTPSNKNKLKEYLEKVFDDPKYALNEIFLETEEESMINFGSMEKPKFRSVANKGDVAEGVIAAAIFARFISKTKKITVNDVKAVLNKAATVKKKVKGKKTVQVFISEKSANANKLIFDDVEVLVILAESNMNSLLDTSVWDNELKDIFKSSAAYANSTTVRRWADLLYKNNQKNKIEIMSAGTEDQTGTKVDVYVLIDGKRRDINISLKAGDVQQFGQVGGTDFAKQKKLWSGLGIDISSLETKYYNKLSEKDVVGAFSLIYEFVDKKDKIDKQKFVHFVKGHATLHEKGVTLVQLSRDTKIYDFDKLTKIGGKYVYSYLTYDRTKKPMLLLVTEDDKELIKIRMKIENKPSSEFGVYVRTYVEKQKALSKLIAETV